MKRSDKFFCKAFLAGILYFAAYNILTRVIDLEVFIVDIMYKVALITILVSAGWCLGKRISPYKVLEGNSGKSMISK
jgi:drug/metabolite transporter (DMT)-like permease